MKLSYEKHVIQLTKKEAKLASTPNTHEYEELQKIRKDFPEFIIVVREINRATKHKSDAKGLSYEKMELYVNKYGSEEQKLQFQGLRGIARDTMESPCVAYRMVKEWFTATFPESTNFALAAAHIAAAKVA